MFISFVHLIVQYSAFESCLNQSSPPIHPISLFDPSLISFHHPRHSRIQDSGVKAGSRPWPPQPEPTRCFRQRLMGRWHAGPHLSTLARSGPSSCPKPSWSHAHSGGAGLRGLDRSACGLGSLFCRWQGFAIPYAVGATMSSFSSSPLPSPPSHLSCHSLSSSFVALESCRRGFRSFLSRSFRIVTIVTVLEIFSRSTRSIPTTRLRPNCWVIESWTRPTLSA